MSSNVIKRNLVPRLLVVGYGNPMRGDDGLGWEVARRIEALCLRGVDIYYAQQLQTELLEEWSRYRRIMLIDAATSGPVLCLRRIRKRRAGASSTHNLTPETLLALSWRLYGRAPEMTLCQMRGEDFTFGAGIPAIDRRVRRAVALVRLWACRQHPNF